MCDTPSNWRSEESLPVFLSRLGVVSIEGVDTRRIVRHLRERGAMRAVISTLDHDPASLVAKAQADPGLVGRDLVTEVAVDTGYTWGGVLPHGEIPCDTGILPEVATYRVVALDSGIKFNILRGLAGAGCETIVLPPTASVDEILAHEPDGVFLANGPGDPSAVGYLFSTLRELLGVKPVFGICLGHQMLSLAVGADTYKLKYGHRGGNQPVMNLTTGRVEMTSQNHGFCVDFESIGKLDIDASGGFEHSAGDLGAWVRAGAAPVVASERFGRVRLTHVNLNDMTVEGIELLDVPAFSVQYHPEAAPGPRDAHYLFDSFTGLMARNTER
jgi:carbamoyl-phosphate synthase small subunit